MRVIVHRTVPMTDTARTGTKSSGTCVSGPVPTIQLWRQERPLLAPAQAVVGVLITGGIIGEQVLHLVDAKIQLLHSLSLPLSLFLVSNHLTSPYSSI